MTTTESAVSSVPAVLRHCLQKMAIVKEFASEDGCVLYLSVWDRTPESAEHAAHGWQCVRQATNFLVEELAVGSHETIWARCYAFDQIDEIIASASCVHAREVNLAWPDCSCDVYLYDANGKHLQTRILPSWSE